MTLPIPVYSIDGSGIDTFTIHRLSADLDYGRMRQPHRDTNFILAFQEAGICELVVDFKEMTISGPSIFSILPGQIHHGTGLAGINAWILAVDGALLDPLTRQVLIESSIHQHPITLKKEEVGLLEKSLQLLEEVSMRPLNALFGPVQRKMLDTCIALFVSIYLGAPMALVGTELRPAMITRSFLGLLLENFRTIKSPKDYAAALNISPSYLNEVVKFTTGFPVSYWIQQEIIMEAKRLLYYTEYTVKEIAFNLGYADTAYFNRIFRNTAGGPPLQFREKSRQQYTNTLP